MVIIDPVKTISQMIWEDIKENKKEWAKFLFWTIPTDLIKELLYWLIDRRKK